MGWSAQDMLKRSSVHLTTDQARELDRARDTSIPVVAKEEGMRPFKPVDFQPVRSPGLYEAEFAVKDEDLIFHFWPWGYHLAQKQDQPEPPFPRAFETLLVQAMADIFEAKRLETHKDADVGAYFVRAKGYGLNQFHRELAIKACEKLHKLLGGEG